MCINSPLMRFMNVRNDRRVLYYMSTIEFHYKRCAVCEEFLVFFGRIQQREKKLSPP